MKTKQPLGHIFFKHIRVKRTQPSSMPSSFSTLCVFSDIVLILGICLFKTTNVWYKQNLSHTVSVTKSLNHDRTILRCTEAIFLET